MSTRLTAAGHQRSRIEPMTPRKLDYYQTAEEIDAQIKELVAQAAKLPPSLAKQATLADISRLRSCASAKRWLEKPADAKQHR